MRMPPLLAPRFAVWLLCGLSIVSRSSGAEILITPEVISFSRPEASQQLLVTENTPDGRRRDVTRDSMIEVLPPGCAKVEAGGLLYPVSDGKTEVVIHYGSSVARVPILVSGLHTPQAVSFRNDILPILTKARCNSGGCHGKAEGQNGFKLSVFGFDPQADFLAIQAEGRGRRISLTSPATSLLLRKGSAQIPHGGGLKLELDSSRYRLLCRWISEGAKMDPPGAAAVVKIELHPPDQVLSAKESQQLQVTAISADGARRCVTLEAEFESNAGTIAAVDEHGLVTATEVPGEAAILARYLGHVAICRITLPRSGTPFARPPENNFIDRLVFDKLQKLGIEPSGLSDDAMFLRRVYLDVTGTLPTSDEARRFHQSTDAEKRKKLIAELLQRPEYVDYWTMRWSDLLRVDPATITPQGAVAMTRWLRRQLSENKPYHQMVHELLVAQGSTLAEGPAAFYKALDTPEKISRSISQLFMGVRIECAQCHHHPSEKWGQDDYFALAGFFTGVSRELGIKGTVPPYINMPHPMSAGGSGFYGAEHAPFVIESDPSQPDFEVRDLRPLAKVSTERFERRRRLLLGAEGDTMEQRGGRSGAMATYYEKAYGLITSSEARKAFDIHAEQDSVRDRYGRTQIGQCALLARRLVEAGCRFVGVDGPGWDVHFNCFPSLKDDLIPPADRAFSALLEDLEQRGLLESTLVVMMGEMGRTPRVNAQAGRDHWSMAQTALFAGGGTKPGLLFGATDKHAATVVSDPVGINDILRTIYRLMGIDADKVYNTPLGRPVPIVDGGRVINALLA